MIEISINGNELRRGGEKIGWIDGRRIYARDGRKMGYFDDHHVYNAEGEKLAYVDGDYLYSENGNVKTSLEKVNEEVEGGVQPGIVKCAVFVLLGE